MWRYSNYVKRRGESFFLSHLCACQNTYAFFGNTQKLWDFCLFDYAAITVQYSYQKVSQLSAALLPPSEAKQLSKMFGLDYHAAPTASDGEQLSKIATYHHAAWNLYSGYNELSKTRRTV